MPISYSCYQRYNYRSYLSIYTALVKRNHSVTMVLPMVEHLRNLLPVSLLKLYSKFWRSIKMFFFLLDKMKLARAQFSMLNLRTITEILSCCEVNVPIFADLLSWYSSWDGGHQAFKYESLPNFRPLSQLTNCINWRNINCPNVLVDHM